MVIATTERAQMNGWLLKVAANPAVQLLTPQPESRASVTISGSTYCKSDSGESAHPAGTAQAK